MSVQDLPPELLQAVVGFTPPSSWKTLRLVNKSFHDHVTPLLFSNVTVWVETQSLKRYIFPTTSCISVSHDSQIVLDC